VSSAASDPGVLRTLAVPDGLDGERLDAALARLFGFSRTRAVELIGQGRVQLDGAVPVKSDRVAAGSWLQVELPVVAAVGPAIISTPVANMAIVYDDDDIVVVDKPVGVAAHPSPGWDGPTVVGALVAAGYRVSTSGAEERQGVVHRLDVGTSGLMAVAKSEAAYTALKQAFRDRAVDKTYHALVQGHPDPARGTIDAPIDRHPVHDYKFAVVADGKPSVTHYETLEAHAMASLLEIKLETGRTHQIRVHMAALRHPCVGDLAYGADPTLAAKLGLTRQWLHAARLGFAHPVDGRWMEFTSEYPADLEHALQVVRAGVEGERRAHS
jgi:23S rRNA pseudouridine1911/1915/1917 synthase